MAVFEQQTAQAIRSPACHGQEGFQGRPSNNMGAPRTDPLSKQRCLPMLGDFSEIAFSLPERSSSPPLVNAIHEGLEQLHIDSDISIPWLDTHAPLMAIRNLQYVHQSYGGTKKEHLQNLCQSFLHKADQSRLKDSGAQPRNLLENDDSSKTSSTAGSSFGESFSLPSQGEKSQPSSLCHRSSTAHSNIISGSILLQPLREILDREETLYNREEPFPVIEWDTEDDGEIRAMKLGPNAKAASGIRRCYSMNTAEVRSRNKRSAERMHRFLPSIGPKRSRPEIGHPTRCLKRSKSFSASLCFIENTNSCQADT